MADIKEKVTVIPERLNCRKKASMDAKVVAIFVKGQELDLEAKTNATWYKVTGLSENKLVTGYCMSEYLQED